jgi:hypothetical protein
VAACKRAGLHPAGGLRYRKQGGTGENKSDTLSSRLREERRGGQEGVALEEAVLSGSNKANQDLVTLATDEQLTLLGGKLIMTRILNFIFNVGRLAHLIQPQKKASFWYNWYL